MNSPRYSSPANHIEAQIRKALAIHRDREPEAANIMRVSGTGCAGVKRRGGSAAHQHYRSALRGADAELSVACRGETLKARRLRVQRDPCGMDPHGFVRLFWVRNAITIGDKVAGVAIGRRPSSFSQHRAVPCFPIALEAIEDVLPPILQIRPLPRIPNA